MNSTKDKEHVHDENCNHDHQEHVHIHGPHCNHHHHEVLKPITREAPKVGRNDPCICGSNQKFKKCCGK